MRVAVKNGFNLSMQLFLTCKCNDFRCNGKGASSAKIGMSIGGTVSGAQERRTLVGNHVPGEQP